MTGAERVYVLPGTPSYDRLRVLATRRFGPAATGLAPDDDLFDKLGIDSLQALDLLTEIEDAFDVEIPDYELQDVRTLASIAHLVAARL